MEPTSVMIRLPRLMAAVMVGVLMSGMALACNGDAVEPEIDVASVDVTPPHATIAVGGTVHLTAQPRDADGTVLSGHPVDFLSSDETLATVDDDGLVTGVAPGTASISATSEGETGTATITVEEPVAFVVVSPSSTTVEAGGTVRLTAELQDADGVPLAGRTVTWTSDDDAVATVDETGLVMGVATGTSEITATSEGVSGTAVVTVIEPLAILSCGDHLPGSIDQAAEIDEYGFYTTVDDAFVLISLTSTGGVVVDGQLIDPSGGEFQSFRASTVRRIEAPTVGLYRVRVNSATLRDAGSYRIGVECVEPLGPVEATLESGDLVSEDLPLPGEVDLFTFTRDAGDRILLSLAGTQGVVADVTLLNPSRTVELTFRADALPLLTLSESGRYVMYVHTATMVNTGAYNLGLESVVPLGSVQGDLIRNNVLSDTIAVPGEVDLFTLTGDAGADFLMTLANTSGIRVDAVILSPEGIEIDRITGNTQKTIQLPEAGTFVVYVFSATGDGTATYDIGVN